MICPLHGGRGYVGHVDNRAPPTPPPQLAAVAGDRCRFRHTDNERRSTNKHTRFNAPCSPADAVENDLFYNLTEGRTSYPGYGWAEPGKGWTRNSYHARSSGGSYIAGTGACPRHGDTRDARRVFKEIHAHSSKTPLSGEMDGSGESCRVHPTFLQSTSKITTRKKPGGDRARDTAWAMSYLSRDKCVPRPERVLRNESGKIAGRSEIQRKQPAKSATSTRSSRKNAADLSEARAMNNKLNSARMYNRGLRDSNSELARQVAALRRKVDAIVAPTNSPPGRQACAELIDEDGHDGGNIGYRARDNAFRTDRAVDKYRNATSLLSSPKSDSPKYAGRHRKKEYGAPGVEHSPSRRLDSPASNHPTEEAHSAKLGNSPEEFKTKRALARAQQTRPQTHGSSPPETYAATRLEAHAQTQTEAVSPVAKDVAVSAAATPHWKPSSVLKKSRQASNGGLLSRTTTLDDSRKEISTAYGDNGGLAADRPSMTEHAGTSVNRAEHMGSRCVLTDPPAIREGNRREEFHSSGGLEREERPEGRTGIDVEAKRAKDHASCASVRGTQRHEGDFVPAGTARTSLGTKGRVAAGEGAGRPERAILDDEDRDHCRGSRLDTQDSDSCCNVGASQEDCGASSCRGVGSAVSAVAAATWEKKMQECSVVSVGDLGYAVERPGLQLPLFEEGSLPPSPPHTSPERNPAVQLGACAKRREEETLVETTTSAENVDSAAQEEVKQLQRKLLGAKRAVAACKMYFVLKGVTPSRELEDAGVGPNQFAALSGGIPRMTLAFARWRNPGGVTSSRGVDETRNISCLGETSSPGGTPCHPLVGYPNSAMEASAAATGDSSQASAGGSYQESPFFLEKTRSTSGVERATDGNFKEQCEKKDISMMKPRIYRPFFLPIPPAPPTLRSRTDGSNVPLPSTDEARLFVPGTKDSRNLVVDDSASKESGSTPESSSLMLIDCRTTERGNRQHGRDATGEVSEVPQGDGGPKTDRSYDDRATPQIWCVSEKEEHSSLAEGEGEGRDETRTCGRAAIGLGDLAVTAWSAEGGRQLQRQEKILSENGRHTAVGLGQVGLHGATVRITQQEMTTEGKGGGERGGEQSALPPPPPPCKTFDIPRKYAKSSIPLDSSSAAENEQFKRKDAEIEGIRLWGRREDQVIRTACTAADKEDNECKGYLDAGCDVPREQGHVEEDLRICGQGRQENASLNGVIEGEEKDTDASYRRDCAVLAGTAKIVFALVALEHRTISSRFYRWKRKRSPSNRLQQPRARRA